MNKKILIIGSTGKLGTKLIKFSLKQIILKLMQLHVKNNKKLIKSKSKKYKIKKYFLLSNNDEKNNFLIYLKYNKFDIFIF